MPRRFDFLSGLSPTGLFRFDRFELATQR